MLRELLPLFAIRAREFSDAVARLGEHHRIGPEFLQLIAEIKKRHELCISTGEDLDHWIEREDPSVHSRFPAFGPRQHQDHEKGAPTPNCGCVRGISESERGNSTTPGLSIHVT
jgi:hypothetical protein